MKSLWNRVRAAWLAFHRPAVYWAGAEYQAICDRMLSRNESYLVEMMPYQNEWVPTWTRLSYAQKRDARNY